MSEPQEQPSSAAEVQVLREEVAELRRQVADLAARASWGDRIAAMVATSMLGHDGMLREILEALRKLNGQVDNVEDKITMTRGTVIDIQRAGRPDPSEDDVVEEGLRRTA